MPALCPHCGSAHVVKAGIRKLKRESVQRFRCSTCLKYFTDRKLKRKAYSAKIILNAVSTYNLGYTLAQTAKELARRFKVRIPQSTLHTWVKEYSNVCRFTRLRELALRSFTPHNIILSRSLRHKQIYEFRLHRAKLTLQAKELPKRKFELLKDYFEFILSSNFPHHIFTIPDAELEKRASQLKAVLLKVTKLEKRNLANRLAELGLALATTKRGRHQAVQDFMLINDSCTIACEVPVYLTEDDIQYFKARGFTFDFESYRTPITGHVDLLQIRNGLVHILDFKPDAERVNAVNQLTIYALALASRTKLAVKDFKCAWFDERSYYEFFPLHGVYRK